MHEIEQTKRIKGGCFKRMNLEIQLERNIHFSNPTPIQRKTLPLVLEGRSLIGIARTGSGKTLCYLLPAIQFAVRNKSTLILVPTKELAYQIRKQLKIYRYKIEFSGRILITTPNDRVDLDQFDMLVVDEFDRILEEESLRKQHDRITEHFDGQRVYFSATLPADPVKEINTVICLETTIPDSISHFFYYVPSESKESALLCSLDKRKKTIIFASTRYGVEYLVDVMNGHGFVALGIYSSMDDEARISHFERFNKNRVNFLVVTDVAARGLDIPRLDCAISYDLSDEKTFVHRVGRVRGVGESVSFVTYSDVFHFFNIKETHLPEAEIGLMPQDVLDKYDMGEFKYKKQQALRGYTKCLKFRKKVSVPSEFKAKIDQFELHTKYRERETLAGQIKRMRHPRAVRTVEEDLRKHDGYRDQFYIPYSRKETLTHSSAFGVERDDYVTEQKTKERIWRRKHVGKEK